jgi:hypothetical protein
MRRHAISSAGANARGRPGSADDDDASAPRDPGHAVKLDGTRRNRNTAAAHGTAAGTAHSNPDAGRPFPKNLPKNPHRAGPRAVRSPPHAPLARQLPNAAVPGNAGSARAAVVAHARSHDSVVSHANAARRGPHPGSADCNTDSADGMAGRVAHTPSAGKLANTCLGKVEQDSQIGHTQAGPRELLLPQVKSRRRGATRLRGVFIGTHPIQHSDRSEREPGEDLAATKDG